MATRNEPRPSDWVESIEKVPIQWAVPDYVARGYVTLLAAPRNAGKTMCAVWLSTEAANVTGLRVWMNSLEDDLAAVLKPRFDAAGATISRQIRLTANNWRLPADLKRIEMELELHKAGGMPDAMLVLDSIQQHIVRPYAHAPAQESISGLLKLARTYNLAVILIGHTTRGKHASVEAMIAGSSVLQNLSKSIYVFGPEPTAATRAPTAAEDGLVVPDEDEGGEGNPRFVMACERMGIAPKPTSILFERLTVHDEVTGRGEPFLKYLGPSSASARDVIDEAKTDDRDSDDAGKTAQSAMWIAETLGVKGPMPTREFAAMAKADGSWHSKNTFDRARKLAGVQSGKRGRVGYVWLRGQEPPA